MSDLYDIAVIGAGPAGSAAAITAARAGARTLLLDRSEFPRQKVCGEFVSAESVGLLRVLLSDPALHVLVDESPGMDSVRLHMDGQTIEARIRPMARSIPRHDMDFALWRSAQTLGVRTICRSTVKEISKNGHFHIQTKDDIFVARAVIDASGRWSELSALPAQVSGRSPWIGIKAHFAEDRVENQVDLYFFEGGYCGVQKVGSGQVNVAAMVRADVARTFSQLFTRHPRLQERSLGWQQLTETTTTSPLMFREPTPTRGQAFCAGDAAAFIDPFMGDGISVALQSGVMAANAALKNVIGLTPLEECLRQYSAAYHRRFQRAFRHAARLRRLSHAPRALRVAALQMMRIRPLADYLVHCTRAT